MTQTSLEVRHHPGAGVVAQVLEHMTSGLGSYPAELEIKRIFSFPFHYNNLEITSLC